jgi:hypothetical protein
MPENEFTFYVKSDKLAQNGNFEKTPFRFKERNSQKKRCPKPPSSPGLANSTYFMLTMQQFLCRADDTLFRN